MLKKTILSFTLPILLLPIFSHAYIASIKAFGMGATGVAYPQDSIASAYNPAGMAEIGDRIDVEGIYLHTYGRSKIKNNLVPDFNGTFHSSKVKNIFGGGLGANKVFYHGECPLNASLGVSIYNRDFLKTSYSKPIPLLGGTKPGIELVREIIAPALSIKLNQVHSFGISLDIAFQRLKINGLENFDDSEKSVAPSHVTNRGYDYSTGIGYTIGWIGHFHRCLSLGISYHPESHMRRFDKYDGFISDHGKFNIPPYGTVGLAFKPICGLVLTFDVQFINWKRIRGLKNPLQPNINQSLLGSKNGPGLGWRNQTIYRFGIAYDLNEDWTIRAGYRHGKNMIKPESTLTNILTLDTFEDCISCGATWSHLCHELSGFFMYCLPHKINGKNSIPLTLGGGEADINQHLLLAGIAWGWHY